MARRIQTWTFASTPKKRKAPSASPPRTPETNPTPRKRKLPRKYIPKRTPLFPETPTKKLKDVVQERIPRRSAAEPKATAYDKERNIYREEILKMMYVAGETIGPSLETTVLLEDIIHEQVVEMIRLCDQQASRRGACFGFYFMGLDDLMFILRHDAAKISFIKKFRAWNSCKGASEAADRMVVGDAEGPGEAEKAAAGLKKPGMSTLWSIESYFNQSVPQQNDEDEILSDAEEHPDMLAKLEVEDIVTQKMNAEDYAYYTRCRTASFTHKKKEKFCVWAGFETPSEGEYGRLTDEFIEAMGFLTVDIVEKMTYGAQKVQYEELSRRHGLGQSEWPPIEVRHVQEAYRRLQRIPTKARAMKNFGGGGTMKSALQFM